VQIVANAFSVTAMSIATTEEFVAKGCAVVVRVTLEINVKRRLV
jgi:hypothetical protein